MMARTITGLQDGLHMQTLNMPNSLWVAEQRPEGPSNQQTRNVEIFVQVVQELVSQGMNLVACLPYNNIHIVERVKAKSCWSMFVSKKLDWGFEGTDELDQQCVLYYNSNALLSSQ